MRFIHPKAYLTSKRNVKKGLISRTKIIQSLEGGDKGLHQMSKESALTNFCIRYHLKALIKEEIVKRTRHIRPFRYKLTGKGQQKLL